MAWCFYKKQIYRKEWLLAAGLWLLAVCGVWSLTMNLFVNLCALDLKANGQQLVIFFREQCKLHYYLPGIEIGID